jgi:dipeptidase E
MIIKKHIIALGGGGFSEEPSPLLDLYVLAQSQSNKPKICFLPTASGDADSYLLKFYQKYAQFDCAPSHLSLFRPHTADIAGFLLDQDIIFVGGGNTKSMIALWREWGVDYILKTAWEKGIILAGISAGAICWFEQAATDSIPGRISALPCLGFLKGSACPHYDGEPERAKTVPDAVARGELKPCLAIDNSCAVHFTDDTISACVSSITGRTARIVSSTGAQPPLLTSYLGDIT